MSAADHQAVYAAELAAFDGTDLEETVPFEAVQALISRVVDGDWWPGGQVEVRRARVDAGSSTTRCAVDGGDRRSTISLSGPQMTVATAAHELGHALAGSQRGHDAVYRRAYLDVVRVITNLDTTDRRGDLHVDQLAAAFAASGLAVGGRSWPAPPPGTGSAFAL